VARCGSQGGVVMLGSVSDTGEGPAGSAGGGGGGSGAAGGGSGGGLAQARSDEAVNSARGMKN
jgi:hypothetical protein